MKWLKDLFKPGYYGKKCKDSDHYFKVITPTLARRVVLLPEEPCQCGHYKNVAESMKEHAKELDQILQNKK